MELGYLLYALVVAYVGMTCREIYSLFHPPRCRGNGCWRALLPLRARVDVFAFVEVEGSRVAVWNATNVSSYDTIEDVLTVPVPPSVRKGVLRDL